MSTTITNYGTLKTAVANWLNRVDLTDFIPDFIRLAEAKFDRHVAIADEVRTTLTLDAEVVTLPAVCRELRSLYLDQDSARGAIEITTPERLAEKKSDLGPSGIPRYAAVMSDGTELGFAPVPNDSFTAKIVYIAGLTLLADDSDTNWILDSHPDLYLYGALVESAPFLRDDERIAVWKAERDERMQDLDLLVQRRRYPTTPVMRPRRAIG